MHESETNDKGQRVVKEAILDLAVNFPEELCTHWIDVSVRAPVAERYTTSEKGCSLRYHGGGGQVGTLQGQALPMVTETLGRLDLGSEKVLNLLAMAAPTARRLTPRVTARTARFLFTSNPGG